LVGCGLLVGGVLLILGTAMGFTNYLITEHVPDHAATWISTAISSRFLFLLALNLLLIVVGCLMDIFSATVVVVPLIVPMAAVFGIHPVHLGVIFLANLELGYLTPPVGLNLFLSSYRFGKPVMQVAHATLPMMAVRLVGVLLITYVPAVTTWLPGLFGK
jgi:TRAP-type C4-dicarboxylate transport system permease large subunit